MGKCYHITETSVTARPYQLHDPGSTNCGNQRPTQERFLLEDLEDLKRAIAVGKGRFGGGYDVAFLGENRWLCRPGEVVTAFAVYAGAHICGCDAGVPQIG